MTKNTRTKKGGGKNKRINRRNTSPAPSSHSEESRPNRWTKQFNNDNDNDSENDNEYNNGNGNGNDNNETGKNVKAQTNRKKGNLSKRAEKKNKAKGSRLSDTESKGHVASRQLTRSETEAHRGLVNLGNTCFFNSVIQVLGHTTSLLQELEAASKFGSLWSALSDCLHALHSTNPPSGSKHSVNPSHLFMLVSKRWPMYKKMKQQDSHEFLRLFIEGLQKEERSLILEPRTLSQPNTLENIFGGMLSSHVQCRACGHTCIIQEPFMDLTLNLPMTKSKHEKESFSISKDLLTEFFKRDDLNHEPVLDCEHCSHLASESTPFIHSASESDELNEILHWFASLSISNASDKKTTKNLRKVSKWNLIQKMPKVLVLHLNLFIRSTFGYTKSFQSLSLEPTLDPSPFLAPDALSSSTKAATFQLFGVVEHSGGASMNSGHYTARIKDPNVELDPLSHAHPWLYFSDEHVSYTHAPYSVTKGRTPYILFYQSLSPD